MWKEDDKIRKEKVTKCNCEAVTYHWVLRDTVVILTNVQGVVRYTTVLNRRLENFPLLKIKEKLQ